MTVPISSDCFPETWLLSDPAVSAGQARVVPLKRMNHPYRTLVRAVDGQQLQGTSGPNKSLVLVDARYPPRLCIYLLYPPPLPPPFWTHRPYLLP